MSADASVFVAACPIVGNKRVAVAHKDSILLTTGESTMTIPLGHSVRALGFVGVPEAVSAGVQTAKKAELAGAISVSGDLTEADKSIAASSSSYIVTGGDDKVLTLLHVNTANKSVSIADTHGPVGKKVSHLLVVPTVSSADPSAFSALVAKPPTGIPPYCPIPTGTFATREAPSVALEDKDKDDEENDENNVKMSGLSAKDAYAVAAGRYYPNQIANVIFGNKFGEVYVIALLQTPSGVVFGPAPVFLLQHFSVLSSIALVGYGKGDAKNSDVARLITCDRDAHTRVSKYPASFEIEQFLWAPYVAPKEGEERPKQQDPVAAVVGTSDGCVIFTGDTSGRVSQYVGTPKASSASATTSAQKEWKAKDYFDFELPALPEGTQTPVNYGGVVGLALLQDGTLLVARDHVSTLGAVRGTDGNEAVTTSVPLPTASSIVALVATPSAESAVALFRDGSLYSVNGDLSFALLASASATASVLSAGSLATVDLYHAWKSVFAENKQRREEEKNSSNEERNKSKGSKKDEAAK